MKFPLNLKPFDSVRIPLIIVSIPVGLPSQDTKMLVSSSECGAENCQLYINSLSARAEV
ncbi:hypothetical protein Mal52_32760 [Symmachiella dynata]|uniref:Uncharacterized protein n=1 Tax=Symmachiella dynata TaxID=2527995 RepID=A0A517ZQP4_9PLAN|nr:hypothetical protein Mal52_32760 [Symmachiella dynata]